MSVFRGLSKEFQVGALTSVAITILILGYNFMRGKDNPFKAGTDVYVYYDSAQGLGIGTSVMFNGLRIGQLSDLDITEDGKRIQAIFEIKSSLNIPKDSKMEIQSQILGGQRVRLVMGESKKFISDGDTLIGDYAHDQFSAINEQIVPLASKADSLLTSMNGFFQNRGLNKALDELPLTVNQIRQLLLQTQGLISTNEMAIKKSLDNVSLFTANLSSYHNDITKTLSRINKLTSGLDSVDLAKSLIKLDSLLAGANQIIQTINSGNGSLGKLVNSDSLHNSIVATTNELNKVLLDLKKYPEKYVPVPLTKGQRKKAKAASRADADIWD
jgi:phospholipid/cholesterol/gamma-HCH transport system substrate-binding protein